MEAYFLASAYVVLIAVRHLWGSEERRVGKGVDLGGRRIIKKKTTRRYMLDCY